MESDQQATSTMVLKPAHAKRAKSKQLPNRAQDAVSMEASHLVDVLSADSIVELRHEEKTELTTRSEFSHFVATNEAEGKKQYQQSLDLFESGTPIVDKPIDLTLKKSSGSIRSTSGVSLLQRKLFNALLFVARPNLSTHNTFCVPVDYLSWSVNHDRVDSAYLRESLREMKKIVIEVEHDKDWGLVSLVGTVVFKGRDLYFELPKAIRNIFSAPKKYYYISMAVNARFRSKYALSLYEMIKESEYRGQTDMMTVEQFRDRMGIEKGEYKEFKRLSARTIIAPLLELEELSDYTAEVQYKTRGRKIIGIQFSNIKPNSKNGLVDDNGDRVKPEYWTMMRDDFGLNRTQIEAISNNYKPQLVEEVCDVIYYRYICKNKPIKNGNRLLVTGLQDIEDKYHLTTKEKTELIVLKERNLKKSLDEQIEEAQRQEYALRKARLLSLWANMTDPQQADTWTAFAAAEESHGITATGHFDRNRPTLDHPAVSGAFMNFALRMGWLDV